MRRVRVVRQPRGHQQCLLHCLPIFRRWCVLITLLADCLVRRQEGLQIEILPRYGVSVCAPLWLLAVHCRVETQRVRADRERLVIRSVFICLHRIYQHPIICLVRSTFGRTGRRMVSHVCVGHT